MKDCEHDFSDEDKSDYRCVKCKVWFIPSELIEYERKRIGEELKKEFKGKAIVDKNGVEVISIGFVWRTIDEVCEVKK